MKKMVDVSFPINISEKEKVMYESHLSFEMLPVKVKKLKNVFVTFSGFCMNNKGLIKESHHNYPIQHNDYLNEASKYYYEALDQPESLIELDNDNTYLVIHHPWFNYYHWICESIFRLWMVRRSLDKFILVLPEYYKDADFIMGSLEPFKLKNLFYIPEGKNLMVKNICLPQLKPICDSYNIRHVRQVRKFYMDYISNEKKIDVAKIDRVYISRELAGRRKVINEDSVLKILFKYNFTIFHPEKFTFLEQVGIFSNIKYLVGTHGSGLTNILFMRENTSILELHKNKTNELNHPSPLFWYLAKALGINYFHQSCDNHGQEDYFVGDYRIDTDLLERNLVEMLNYK